MMVAEHLTCLAAGLFRPAVTRSESLLKERLAVTPRMLEGAQEIRSSSEIHCSEHVDRMRESMLFNRFCQKSAGMVHAVRVLLERGYPERGFTKSRGLVPLN
jgi:hypothetical protein